MLAESGVTAVFATHDRGEALGLGGRVAVLMRGRIAQVGSAERVFGCPEEVEVARFVGIETLIPGRVTGTAGGLVQIDCGEIRLEAEGDSEVGEEVYVAVRPEEIALRAGGSAALDDSFNVISGRVTKTVPAETHYRVEIDCGVPVVAVVSRATFREMPFQAGQRVQATFTARAAHLIRRASD